MGGGSGRRLSDLKVVELRAELQRRGLDTKGNKPVLLDRLSQALEKEGLTLDQFLAGGDHQGQEEESVDQGQEGDSQDHEHEQEEHDHDQEEKEEEGEEPQVVADAPKDAQDDEKDEVEADPRSEEILTLNVSHSTLPMGDDTEEEMRDESTESVVLRPPPKEEEREGEETHVSVSGERQAEGAEGHHENDNDGDTDALHLTIGEEDELMIDGEANGDHHSSEHRNGNEETGRDSRSEHVNGDGEEGNDRLRTPEKAGDSQGKDAETNGITSSHPLEDNNHREDSEGRKKEEDDKPALLVTGLSPRFSATEIKNVFKKYGKIGGVKIMMNSKDPERGSRFALVIVLTSEDAESCIKHLDGADLQGRIIHVDYAKTNMLRSDVFRKEQAKVKNEEEGKKEKEEATPNSGSKDATAVTGKEDTAAAVAAEKKEAPAKTTERKNSTGTATTAKEPAAKSSSPGEKEKEKKKDSSKPIESGKREESRSHSRPSTSHDRRPRDIHRSRSPGGHNRDFRRRPGDYSAYSRERGLRVAPVPRARFEEDHRRHHAHAHMEHHGHHRRDRDDDHYHHRYSSRSLGRVRRVPDRRSRSPPVKVPYRGSGALEGRRGRQPELTFEDIYDVRQREKERELERSRREAERRRIEEAEKQRMLDEEFRRLQRERERIEAEKAELKRQKEKLIMEEKEKQRLELAEIQRQKAEMLARSAKRAFPEEAYALSHKKLAMDDRERRVYAVDSAAMRSERDKRAAESYRRDAVPSSTRYGIPERNSSSSVSRGVPVRDARISPTWEPKSRHGSSRGSERVARVDPLKMRDEGQKQYSNSSASQLAASNRYYETSSSASAYPSSASARLPGSASAASNKVGDPYSSYSKDSRWISVAGSSASLPYEGTTGTLPTRPEVWSSRDPSWMSDRTGNSSGRLSDLSSSDRWVSGSSALPTGRPPLAPPPPVFSHSSAAGGLPLSSLSSSYGNNGLYSSHSSSSYDYKIPSTSHRR